MREYKFICNKNLEEKSIRNHIEQKYDIVIDSNTLYDSDRFKENINSILEKKLEVLCLDSFMEIIEDEESEEEKRFKNRFLDITKIFRDIDSYRIDLMTDTYMGLLQMDNKYALEFDPKLDEAWNMEACNSNIDVQNARKHYPYTSEGMFPNNKIPGGCENYHKLMMMQSNIGIFDISEDLKSLQRYAFPRTYRIYDLLKECCVENLILLELTQGIGYTNQIYHYVKNITKREELDKFVPIISEGLKINPMFLRKNIVEILWDYLEYYDYSEKTIECIEMYIDEIVYSVNIIYNSILEFVWCVYWLAYKGDKKNNILYNMQLELKMYWERYFNMDEAYEHFIESENLHDWRNIKSVKDCFYQYKSPLSLIFDFDTERITFLDGTQRCMQVGKPINSLGKKILKETISEIKKEICLSYNDIKDEELLNLYNEIREKVFNDLRETEKILWDSKDPKNSTKNLKPLHIYAIVHALIVRKLN